jgi:hypothetical protein
MGDLIYVEAVLLLAPFVVALTVVQIVRRRR